MKNVKDNRLKEELKKLTEIYKDIPENKRKLVNGLIENAAFMKVTLDDLQDVINKEGSIIISKNGNGFETTQEHPAQKSYNNMINRYLSVINKLDNDLPVEEVESDGFDDF